jgi:hypothetical protein
MSDSSCVLLLHEHGIKQLLMRDSIHVFYRVLATA